MRDSSRRAHTAEQNCRAAASNVVLARAGRLTLTRVAVLRRATAIVVCLLPFACTSPSASLHPATTTTTGRRTARLQGLVSQGKGCYSLPDDALSERLPVCPLAGSDGPLRVEAVSKSGDQLVLATSESFTFISVTGVDSQNFFIYGFSILTMVGDYRDAVITLQDDSGDFACRIAYAALAPSARCVAVPRAGHTT